MKKLAAEIKTGIFHNVYLLTGPERYLRLQYCSRLRDAIRGNDTLNVNTYKGPLRDINEITDLALTMPFLSDHRVIVLEDSGIFSFTEKASKASATADVSIKVSVKGSEDDPSDPESGKSGKSAKSAKSTAPADIIKDLIEDLPDTTHIIFSEESADKRGRLYKAIQKSGSVTEFSVQDNNTLAKWIMGLAREDGLSISRDTALYLVQMTGRDMTNLRSEWDKLSSYCMGRDAITPSDIDAICTRTVEDHVFDMIDAMSDGDKQKALALYGDLVALSTAPMKILNLISRHFRILNSASYYMTNRLSKYEIASKLGQNPRFMDKYLKQASHYGPEGTRDALEYCADTETRIKSGLIKDSLGVEMMIAKFSTR